MKWNILALYILIFGFAVVGAIILTQQKRTAYVVTTDVYDKFQMSKELNEKIKKLEDTRKNILDSLVFKLKMKQQSIENSKGKDVQMINEFEGMKQEYFMKQKQFEEDNAKIKDQYFDQIWTQLNQYVQEFGKKNSYVYILGATGQGTLMYADETINVTNDLVEYVNQRYNDTAK